MGWFNSGEKAGKKADDRYDEQVEVAYDAAMDQVDHANESGDMNYVNAVVANAAQRYNLETQILWQEETAMRQWDYEAEQHLSEYNAKVDAYNKSERLFGAQVGLNEHARQLADEAAAAVRGERLDAVKFQGMKADIESSQTKTDIAQQKAGLNINLYKQRSDIDLKKQAAALESQQRRAESAFNSEKQLVEMIQAAGSTRAKGQAGRSAQKNIQAIMATGGRAQAQLADQITRGDSAYNLTMMGLDKSLIYGDAEHKLATAGLTSKGVYADMMHDLGVKERDATKLSIGSAYDRALSKSEFDEYGANLAADAKRMAEPGFGSLPPKPLELPRAILLDPMMNRHLPEPRKGAGSGGVGAAQGAANDTSMIVNGFLSLATAGLMAMCDMRVKHEAALLEYTEVNDALAMLAFAVKELREHS